MNAQPTWQRLPTGYYIDPLDLRAANLAQSAATVGGRAAPFQLYRSKREPIAECHNPRESPIAERAYTAEQEARLYAGERTPRQITDYANRRGE